MSDQRRTQRAGWLDVAEVGGAFGIRFLVIVCTAFGRAPARVCLRLVALYYTLFHATARRASRDWMARIHGAEHVTSRMVYDHLLRFSHVALDRLFFVRRQIWRFETRFLGQEVFKTVRAGNKGVLFLGAHVGSFEAIRVLAEQGSVRINIVGYFRNALMINTALQQLDPTSSVRIIDVEPGQIDFIFTIKDRIDRGEHVAILADRAAPGRETVEAEFMGSPARFPSGVYLLAAALRCPVYLVFALYREPNRYDIHCELFAEQVVLPRKARSEAIAGYVSKYAERLEHYSRLAPDNWFNFYDFWNTAPQGRTSVLKRGGRSATY